MIEDWDIARGIEELCSKLSKELLNEVDPGGRYGLGLADPGLVATRALNRAADLVKKANELRRVAALREKLGSSLTHRDAPKPSHLRDDGG